MLVHKKNMLLDRGAELPGTHIPEAKQERDLKANDFLSMSTRAHQSGKAASHTHGQLPYDLQCHRNHNSAPCIQSTVTNVFPVWEKENNKVGHFSDREKETRRSNCTSLKHKACQHLEYRAHFFPSQAIMWGEGKSWGGPLQPSRNTLWKATVWTTTFHSWTQVNKCTDGRCLHNQEWHNSNRKWRHTEFDYMWMWESSSHLI